MPVYVAYSRDRLFRLSISISFQSFVSLFVVICVVQTGERVFARYKFAAWEINCRYSARTLCIAVMSASCFKYTGGYLGAASTISNGRGRVVGEAPKVPLNQSLMYPSSGWNPAMDRRVL